MRIKWLLLLGVIIGGVLAWSQLPEEIPVHWNAAGEIDDFGGRWTIWMAPVIMAVMMGLFHFLPKIDPKKENYKKFAKEYQWIQVGLMGFFAYFFVLQVGAGLSDWWAENLPRLLIGGMGLMFVLVGQPMKTLKQNFFVGIRTPWTLTNAKSWKKTHELGGKLFMAMGLAILLMALINWLNMVTIISVILAVVVLVFVYSYYAKE